MFVAVRVPRDRLDHLARAAEPLRPRFPGARWTDPANQHVTLKFLGWAAADLLAEIEAACEAVASAHAPAELSLGHLGSFPGTIRVRVLWVGLDDPSDLLAGLATDLDRALAPLGFEPEQRGFTAHLTLARMKTPARIGEWPEVQLDRMPWTCDEMVLYRSHLSPKGARYEALASFALGNAAT